MLTLERSLLSQANWWKTSVIHHHEQGAAVFS